MSYILTFTGKHFDPVDDYEYASDPMDRMEDVCSNVDSAYEELNEAIDAMEKM